MDGERDGVRVFQHAVHPPDEEYLNDLKQVAALVAQAMPCKLSLVICAQPATCKEWGNNQQQADHVARYA
jgi:hypothetical protein